ncbi:MAG: holo-ACP synthase [Rickettsiales bacterium]
MIYGIGTDIISVERIESAMRKGGVRFLSRLFTDRERAQCETRYGQVPDRRHVRFYAKRFAAKEAFSKALGTGFREGVRFQDIDVFSDDLGAPSLQLRGAAQAAFRRYAPGQAKISLSLSDEAQYAVAFVLIQAG